MYEIAGKTYAEDGPALQAALSTAYSERVRPRCCCQKPGVEMYIAKLGETYIVKRMPGSGERHLAGCTSYEPPASLSGLGDLLGTAIQTHPENGTVSLRLDFPLTRKAPGGSSAGACSDSVSVRPDPARLSLRAMLHYLFDQAGLTHWSPAMEGKRNWWVVRKHLLLAAEGKLVKGAGLRDQLFIPESFSAERKDEIARRRRNVLSPLAVAVKGSQRLMLMIGEIKELGRSRTGGRFLVKHMPDTPLFLSEVLYRRALRRFAREIDLWNANESSHLLFIAVFGLSLAGTATLEELSLMNVDERWLPFEDMNEKELIDVAVMQGRRFVKTLRYNANSAAAIPALVLVDSGTTIPLYIVPHTASEEYLLEATEKANGYISWHWDATKKMPTLPT